MSERITKETRRQSYDGILPERGKRCRIILEIVAPRLTELKDEGVVEVVGKKPSKRTGKNTAVWAVTKKGA